MRYIAGFKRNALRENKTNTRSDTIFILESYCRLAISEPVSTAYQLIELLILISH
jgi:hypothetical protein